MAQDDVTKRVTITKFHKPMVVTSDLKFTLLMTGLKIPVTLSIQGVLWDGQHKNAGK